MIFFLKVIHHFLLESFKQSLTLIALADNWAPAIFVLCYLLFCVYLCFLWIFYKEEVQMSLSVLLK